MGTSHELFDVIIVGGGTAGLVIANRLSEIAEVQVIIIEAGSDRNADPKIMTPGFMIQTFGDKEYDWCYTTVPQEALGDKTMDQTRGKGKQF
jgi:choline dehydrogenase-like flavoprotein